MKIYSPRIVHVITTIVIMHGTQDEQALDL